jgi:Flp pilus assembly protein protease CpaA
MQIYQTLDIVVILTVFCYASYLDIRTRKVPFKTWYPAFLLCPVLVLLTQPDLFYLIAFCITAAGIYIVGYLDQIGGADAWAFIFIFAFVVIPLKLTMVDYIFILLEASIIGLIAIGGIYLWKRRWEHIPYIPALTASLVYFFLFGAPL